MATLRLVVAVVVVPSVVATRSLVPVVATSVPAPSVADTRSLTVVVVPSACVVAVAVLFLPLLFN
jgi:hypothetical protein